MTPSRMQLIDESRVAVIGGGPAGSLTSYFLLVMADRAGIKLLVDVYEPKDFHKSGPGGCNMCAGVVSESLIQALAAEGIKLPDNVVRRGIDSYVLHTDQGTVRISTPSNERRIASVYRGAGPRGESHSDWLSFDGYLMDLAVAKGANWIHAKVERIDRELERPRVWARNGEVQAYDLIVAAVGLNGVSRSLFEGIGLRYEPPPTMRGYIREFRLDEKTVNEYFGSSMHVFMLDIPGLEFAAMVPKGSCATLCMLGQNIDNQVIQSFLHTPVVKACFPAACLDERAHCQCAPKLCIGPAIRPFDDRFVFVGDCGVSRLYKDGIGAAYRTAKAAATAAVFQGVSAVDFERHFWPACHALIRDNRLGNAIFAMHTKIRKLMCVQRAIVRLAAAEQSASSKRRTMSTILWNLFTGSAPYQEILMRGLNPLFLLKFLWSMILAVPRRPAATTESDEAPGARGLGRWFRDGDIIIRQGECGDCMYVIQEGQVEVLRHEGKTDVRLAVLAENDFFGEAALFEREQRCATVRALGDVRVLAVDRKTLMRRLSEDSSLAYRILQTLSGRVRTLDRRLTQLIIKSAKVCDSTTTIGIVQRLVGRPSRPGSTTTLRATCA
jgi:flavin-dependent dehydrogenase